MDHALLAGQANGGLRVLGGGERVVLHLAERVERRHERDAPDLLRSAPDPAREPVMAVDDVVGGALVSLPAENPAQERRQEARQLAFGNRSAWPGLHLDDAVLAVREPSN